MSRYLLTSEETERLSFRKVLRSDFETWLPFYHDPSSTQFWEGVPEDPKTACEEQFARIFDRYENDLGGMNALVLKTSNELVGMCGLLKQIVDELPELEIGYSLLPQFRGMGYASEAAIKCKQFAFEHGLALSLISIIHVDNLPSQKVAERNDMKLDKTTSYKGNPVHIYRVYA